MKNKIFNLKNLSSIIKLKKKQNKKIVLCHGVFDLVHLGHLEHFKNAKAHGDILIVTTTSDKFINKGPNRPYFKNDTRQKLLEGISCIDYISEINSDSAIPAIEALKPDFYCKGNDYKNKKDDITKKISKELQILKNNNGKFIITNEVSFSSSKILTDHNLVLNNKQKKEFSIIKNNYTFEKIKKILSKIKKLKVLVIGELIIDKYNFCDPLGKSGKDPIMMFQKLYYEEYLGGAAAISNNIGKFCEKVKLISMIGNDKKFQRFIKSKIIKTVSTNLLIQSRLKTILKEKYIDNVSKSKLIGFYDFSDNQINSSEENILIKKINKQIKNYDVTIVADYGHNIFSNKVAKLVANKSKFLAVNSQINAANIYHHSIDKFSKTEITMINEGELRHELRDRNNDVKKLVLKLNKIINTKFIVITMGVNGALLFNCKSKKFVHSASYANSVVDKIGSGDTMLSILSIFLKITNDPALSMLLASLAAAENVGNFGNSKNIDPNKILKVLQHLF